MEGFLLTFAVLFFVSIWACKAGYKFGVPILLLFLIIGMVFGSDGLKLIIIDDFTTVSNIGSVALCIILFSGGLDTKIQDIKPVIKEGVILATVGVFLTAVITGFVIRGVFDLMLGDVISISLLSSLMLASTMASTDSASVFSILRSKNLNLKNNLRPLLESESGSNDPVAYMMTASLISLVQKGGSPDYLLVFSDIVIQLIVGALIGFVVGKLLVAAINKLNIDNASLYPIAILSGCIFMYSSAQFVNGNSYLAVYVGGLVVGNSRFLHKRSSINFFDGIAWLSQLIMFLTLGLLVDPHELTTEIVPGLLISVVMMLIARPITVFLCLAPFKRNWKEKLFVSWVGLKGAAPIIFAIMILSADTPYAKVLFNIVFVCTLISLIVQGSTLSIVAKKLKLIDDVDELSQPKNFDVDFSDEIKSVTTEIMLSSKNLEQHGNLLMNLPFPENTLVVMVKRDGNFFVPKGKTKLKSQDKLLLITDNRETLIETLNSIGIEYNNVQAEKIENSSIIDDIRGTEALSTIKHITNKTIERTIGKIIGNDDEK